MQLNIKSQVMLNHVCLATLYTSRMNTTGTRLKDLREKSGLNQDQLGEICGVTKGMVSQWENDIVTPPIERMMLLKKKYHFKLDWLYCEDGQYRPELEALYAIAKKLPVYAVVKLTSEGSSYTELIKSAKQDHNKNGTQ
jgi:transcriptional regulator with XRE-family HTH domain